MQRKVSHFRAPLSIPRTCLISNERGALFWSVHTRAVLCVINTVVTSTYAKRSNIVFRHTQIPSSVKKMRPSNIKVNFKVYNKADTVNGQVLAVTRSQQYKIFFDLYLQSQKTYGMDDYEGTCDILLKPAKRKKVQILIFVSFAKNQMINPLEKPKHLQYRIS